MKTITITAETLQPTGDETIIRHTFGLSETRTAEMVTEINRRRTERHAEQGKLAMSETLSFALDVAETPNEYLFLVAASFFNEGYSAGEDVATIRKG